MAQSGQLRAKVGESQLIELLSQLQESGGGSGRASRGGGGGKIQASMMGGKGIWEVIFKSTMGFFFTNPLFLLTLYLFRTLTPPSSYSLIVGAQTRTTMTGIKPCLFCE